MCFKQDAVPCYNVFGSVVRTDLDLVQGGELVVTSGFFCVFL